MYNEDISDRESECEEKSLESPHFIKKSLSTIGFCNTPEIEDTKPLALRSTKSFTGAVEELRLCSNFQKLNVNRINVIATSKSPVCPCGCFLRSTALVPFRTREKSTLALHVVPPDVLNYHGYNFEPCQIAMLWKKDCRMFLWKGKSKKI